MAVTVSGSTIRLTAQGDEFALPIVVKSIFWTGATTAGHLLELAESSTLGSTSNVIYRSVADAANYVDRSLIERYYPNGIEVTDLDSGEVQIIYA